MQILHSQFQIPHVKSESMIKPTKTETLQEIQYFFISEARSLPRLRKDPKSGWIELEEIKWIAKRGNFVGEVDFGLGDVRSTMLLVIFCWCSLDD